ncbi:MAG: CAP domain-containing protein [Polyangiaceae bacterium]
MKRASAGAAILAATLLSFGGARADGLATAPPLAWRVSTSAPSPAISAPGLEAIYDACGRPDDALVAVAGRNAGRLMRGEPGVAADELGFDVRAAGAPHVWPRAWSMEGEHLADDTVLAKVTKWASGASTLGERRCGVVRATTRSGLEVVSAVQADVLADLDPLPTLARVGEWVSLRGHMLVPASDAKVVLLGPRGAPKTVLASLSKDDVRATFSVDKPGAWFVQVLATVSTGPRPVLEAWVFAGVDPPAKFEESPAPGEDTSVGGLSTEDALLAMVNAARASEGLGALDRDATLDALALAHSELMVDTKTVGHDVGDGDPKTRLVDAGISATAIGENVASAATLPRAHRALWASPSHRGNLLEKRFKKMGVGVVTKADGRVWVTELFMN